MPDAGHQSLFLTRQRSSVKKKLGAMFSATGKCSYTRGSQVLQITLVILPLALHPTTLASLIFCPTLWCIHAQCVSFEHFRSRYRGETRA